MPERSPRVTQPEYLPDGYKLYFITESGSRYYLTDQDTLKRFRVGTTSGSWRSERQLYGFIPPYSHLKALLSYLPQDEFEELFGSNQLEFTKLLLNRVKGTTTNRTWMTEFRDFGNQTVSSTKQLQAAESVSLYLKKDPADPFSQSARYPLSKVPQTGWRPVDVLLDSDGNYFDIHLGHLVSEVFDIE